MKLPPHAYEFRASDCAVWALAALTSVPYEDVLIEVARVDTSLAGAEGLWVPQIIKVAARLGVKLRLKRTVRLDDDCGLVGVKFVADPQSHVALLKGGQVVDSIGGITMWDADVYFAPGRAVPDGILVPVDT